MKMNTKWIAILLVLGMVFTVLASCDNKTPATPNGPGSTPGNSTQGATTQTPDNTPPATKYGNYSSDAPVLTPEEIFAEQIKKSEETYATGSSYDTTKVNNVYKIADYIANYEKYVAEYELEDELEDLYEDTGFTLDLGFGAAMIKHYVDMSGDTYEYSDQMAEMLEHPKVAAAQATTVNAAMKAAENLVADGQSGVSVNQSTPMSFSSLSSTDGPIYFALGSYYTMADLSNVQRTGDRFTATLTFRIVDFYSWDESNTEPDFTTYLKKLDDSYRALLNEMVDMPTLESFCPADMAQLHYAGFAQNFLAHGTATYTISWTAGQTFAEATVTPAQ